MARCRPAAPGQPQGRALIAEQEAALRERQGELDKIKAAVARFSDEYEQWRSTHTKGELHVLDGIDATRERIAELADSATSEMMAFSMGAQARDTIEAGRRVDQFALDRGLRLRGVYLDSVRNHPATYAHARWLAEQGAEIRTTPLLPTRMVIFDRTAALLHIDPEHTRDGAVLLRGAGPLCALVNLFERLWLDATPIDSPAPERVVAGLDKTERAVLRLLAEGLTDEAVARKLGVSLRTVRRMMARLARELDTQSRFATGVRVAKLGLL